MSDEFAALRSENNRLKSELAKQQMLASEIAAERDRYIARCQKLESERQTMRELLK